MLREAVVGRDKKGDELIPRNGFEILGDMIALALQENSKAISHGEPGMKLCSRFEINDPHVPSAQHVFHIPFPTVSNRRSSPRCFFHSGVSINRGTRVPIVN